MISNNPSECILVTLKSADVYLNVTKKQGVGIVQPGSHKATGDGLSHITGNDQANMAVGAMFCQNATKILQSWIPATRD